MCHLAKKRHFATKRHLADFLVFQKNVTWQMRQLAEKRHFNKKKEQNLEIWTNFWANDAFLGSKWRVFCLKRYFYRGLFVRNWTAGATGSNNSDSETKLPRKCYSCSSSRWNKSKIRPFRWLRNRRSLSAPIYGQIAKWFPSISARVSKVDFWVSLRKLRNLKFVADRSVKIGNFWNPLSAKSIFKCR